MSHFTLTFQLKIELCWNSFSRIIQHSAKQSKTISFLLLWRSMSCFCLSSQPLYYRHHEPSNIICPQPATSPQLQVHCCWYHSWLLDKLRDFQVLFFFPLEGCLSKPWCTCLFSDQMGAVCQPHGASERLPRSLSEEEADRDGNRQPNA